MKKKNLLFALLMMICISNFTLAQITFQKTFGGTGGDVGESVQQTTDGGYIIVGNTTSFGAGSYDVYLIKTNTNGDTLWTKTFGGTDDDYGYSVQQTADGGYIIAGYTKSFGAGNEDVYLIKTTGNGDTLWTKTYGGLGADYGFSVQNTSDGGYVITGTTTSFGAGAPNVYLIKATANGDTLWTKTFGGIHNDGSYSIQQTSDDGYIIAGYKGSPGVGNYHVYLIKTTGNGDTSWTRTYGGTNGDWGFCVQQTSDGGYIIAGMSSSFDESVYIIKTTANGDTLWTKTVGGTNFDAANCIQQTSDGGYIIAGITYSFGAGSYDVYLIKTTANGDTLWTKTLGGTDYDGGISVQQTTDGGYIITGSTESIGAGNADVYLIKTDANGNSGCNQGNPATITSKPATQQTSPNTIVTSPATLVSSTATIIGSGGTITTLCTSSISEFSPNSENINIYPNPASDNIIIEALQKSEIEISDIKGQIIKRFKTKENKTNIDHVGWSSYVVDVSDFSSGVYIIKAITDSGITTKKFIKE